MAENVSAAPVHESMPYGKVLIVDDMKSNLDVAVLLLKQYELHADTAESGYRAVELVNASLPDEYDIIFMDHMMPGMDGLEAAKKIRSLGYKNPLIALSAFTEEDTAENEAVQTMFLAHGFDACLAKPLNKRELGKVLDTFLQKKISKKLPPENQSETEHPDSSPCISIPGIDAKKGLALYGNNREIYITVLRSFVSNALSNNEKIRRVSFSAATLNEYAANAHGIKGISANIGAEQLREEAAELELSAKSAMAAGQNELSGMISSIAAANKVFLATTEKTAAAIKAWLDANDTTHQKPRLACPDRALLVQLRQYCIAYNMSGADSIMEQLENANYDSGASLISRLREKINESDFGCAAEYLTQFLEESK